MFMIRVYDSEGNRTWLDNGYIWEDVEEINKRLEEEIKSEKAILGKADKTYTVIPINMHKSRMKVYMPMTDKEVEISDITFKDGEKGFIVKGDKSIGSFLYAWVEKHSNDLDFSRHSIESSVVDGDTLTITVKGSILGEP